MMNTNGGKPLAWLDSVLAGRSNFLHMANKQISIYDHSYIFKPDSPEEDFKDAFLGGFSLTQSQISSLVLAFHIPMKLLWVGQDYDAMRKWTGH